VRTALSSQDQDLIRRIKLLEDVKPRQAQNGLEQIGEHSVNGFEPA